MAICGETASGAHVKILLSDRLSRWEPILVCVTSIFENYWNEEGFVVRYFMKVTFGSFWRLQEGVCKRRAEERRHHVCCRGGCRY